MADGEDAKRAALLHDLGERVKELTALHACARLLLTAGEDATLFAEVAALVPPAFQHADVATASVSHDGHAAATPGHAATAWMLRAPFATADGRAGAIEVAYHAARPDAGCGLGPFLREEDQLLRSLSDMLGLALDRQRAERAARHAREDSVRQAQQRGALAQVAGGVAHDFNNLLIVVMTTADVLRQEVVAEEHLALLDELFAAGQHGAALARQLLAFSRRAELAPEAVTVDALVGRLRPLLQRIAGDVRVTLAPAAGPAQVWVDPTQLEQVLTNLVANARDAMPTGGTVTIATAAEGDRVSLTVRDTGPGIAPALLPHVFEPFVTTKPPGTGTGLGLAVVRAVAQRWAGDVTVTSPPGAGATFHLRLPRHATSRT